MRLVLLADAALPDSAIAGSQQWCAGLAEATGEPVELVVTHDAGITATLRTLHDSDRIQFRDIYDPPPSVSAAPMSSAEFVWREDGRPDWAAMWTSFCDLALYGGPPHRGEETALRHPDGAPVVDADDPMIAEIRRGIWETTGLFAEPAEEPGWLAITCDSRKMAAWLCACIILENVDARCDEERLFVPASPQFTLKDEVKSVITVVAKTVHYWQAHVEAREGMEAGA